MAMNKQVVIIIATVALAALAAGGTYLQSHKGTEPAADCKPAEVAIDRENSVHGLKDGKLFAYVDLAAMSQDLACNSDAVIQAAVATAVTTAVNEWWKEERLAKADAAEIHIISILDKDEYVKADFNAALVHGKLEYARAGGKVEAKPATLAFDNMRKALDK